MLDFYVDIFENPLTPSIDSLVNAVADPINFQDTKVKIKDFQYRSPKKQKKANNKRKLKPKKEEVIDLLL